MQLRRLLFLVTSCFSNYVIAQRHEVRNTTEVESLKMVFVKAEVEGHIRNYFMSTMNEGNLKDYYTNATGGAIGIKTLPFKNFSLGIKGIFTYQTFSSDLNEKDEASQKASKWEHELYDINDLENYNDLDRLEELYIDYTFKKGIISAGKMPIEETIFVNKSDGRMKPFAFSGIQAQLNFDSTTHFYIAYIGRVSPRSAVEWYNFDEAIGIVTNGNQPNGLAADYAGYTNSKGMSIVGLEKQIENSSIKLYHYHLHQILNTSIIEGQTDLSNFEFTIQYVFQFADQFQQSLAYENRYVQASENGQLLSLKSAYNAKKHHFFIAYTHLFATGRFLFPKELGRDRINTSISRSRAEGLGNSNVFTINYEYCLTQQTGFRVEATTILQNNPESAKYNKYNLDNYYQINTRIKHKMKAFFEGLECSLLYVYKKNYEENQVDLIFNRSNFHQINLIANYNF